MSADVMIADESFNYTHNLSKLFYDHIPDQGKGGGLRELEGITGSQAIPILRAFFDNVDHTRFNCKVGDAGAVGDPVFCAKYDAKNGWGTSIGAIIFVSMILGACAAHPRAKVRISL